MQQSGRRTTTSPIATMVTALCFGAFGLPFVGWVFEWSQPDIDKHGISWWAGIPFGILLAILGLVLWFVAVHFDNYNCTTPLARQATGMGIGVAMVAVMWSATPGADPWTAAVLLVWCFASGYGIGYHLLAAYFGRFLRSRFHRTVSRVPDGSHDKL